MGPEIEKIANLFQASYDGEPWHGLSIEAQLEGVDAAMAAKKIHNHKHSIWELVMHMIAWREFCMEKLDGNAQYKIKLGGKVDWPPLTDVSEEKWEITKSRLWITNRTLFKQILNLEEYDLHEKAPGEKYSYFTLLHGIMQHDAYHSGQIGLLKKLA